MCPSCGRPFELDAAGAIPARCPACQRRLRVADGGYWAHFRAAFAQYATFSGRATRKEFWSFIIVSHTIICLFVLLLLWPFASLLHTCAEQLQAVGGFVGLDEMDAEQTRAFGRSLKALILEELGSPGLFVALIVGCAGILLTSIGFIVPTFAVTVRRLHDAGWSGWWVGAWCLITYVGPFLLIPFVFAGVLAVGEDAASLLTSLISLALQMASSGISLLIFVLCFFDSQRGANAYGPSAKYPLG